MARTDREKAVQIVADAGGRIVGRTRMQKVAFLLEIAGLGEGFQFEYKHFGPYSEELTDAMKTATAFGLVSIDEQETSWGGWYSVYSVPAKTDGSSAARVAFASEAAKIEAVQLELAATAAFLRAVEGYSDPWAETERRKPEKARDGRLERAKIAYARLMSLPAGANLPRI